MKKLMAVSLLLVSTLSFAHIGGLIPKVKVHPGMSSCTLKLINNKIRRNFGREYADILVSQQGLTPKIAFDKNVVLFDYIAKDDDNQTYEGFARVKFYKRNDIRGKAAADWRCSIVKTHFFYRDSFSLKNPNGEYIILQEADFWIGDIR